MSKKSSIGNLIHRLEASFDFLKFSIKKRRNNFDPALVVPYLGYGTEKVFYVKGRLLENKGIVGATKEDSIWRNLGNMYKRFESDEIPSATLRIFHGNKTWDVQTDEEGYFEINIEPDFINKEELWQEGQIEIIECPVPYTQGIKYSFKILTPKSTTSFGIISDVDDTIVRTNATSYLKMFTVTFLNNAHTRSPFEGASEFYKALHQGISNNLNPLFYVSSSPWNLYDMLIEFLITHDFPLGPLLLKDYGLNKDTLISEGHLAHKYYQIQKILNTYPLLSFILIGDNGQEDPSIYHQVVKDFPDRIKVIYIRDVNIPKHTQKFVRISEDNRQHKVDMLLVKDSQKAAEDAVKRGLIEPTALSTINQDISIKSKQ